MSTKIKFYTLIAGLALFSQAANSQTNATLEMTTGGSVGSPAATGNGFGPRTTNHVIRLDRDNANNNTFSVQSPSVTATVSLENQSYTGLTYGAGTTNATGSSNAISTGLVFGAGPSLPIGAAPGLPDGQQASPLNSYFYHGFIDGSGGPVNGMFMSDPTASPVADYPGANGTGLDISTGNLNKVNMGVAVFTTAQVLFDQNQPNNTTTGYYYGDLVVTFSQFVQNPVIHFAGLGGSYRYLPAGAPNADTSSYTSTFFSTELELAGGVTMTKLSGNEFLSLNGANTRVLNTSARPNGASLFVTPPDAQTFHNYGAASGSVRINATVRSLRFRVYLRGSAASQFNWSSTQAAVPGAVRPPLTGDIWYVSASLKPQQLISLPSTGVTLSAVLANNDVTLNWKTLTEVNSKKFEIERSTDGINFVKVGEKAAAGYSVTDISYNHVDPNMSADIYYYRLKIIDLDNRFTYSNNAIVRKGSVKSISVFPNPVTDYTNIEFTNAKGVYSISIINQAGQILQVRKAEINGTVQYVRIEKGSLPTGMYHVRIVNTESGEINTQKLIVK